MTERSARGRAVYQLVMDEEGKVVDVRTAPGIQIQPRRLEAAKATIYYTPTWVPIHVCYDDERLNHQDDRNFCRKARGVTND